ncbi:MAG TPA: DUF397 domain-containing protein [Streptomyces sp.]|nr:DUF397 domain-containing protein [Streptomyces sp.]
MTEDNWQRSSFCSGGGNNCVEVAATDNGLALRESESPARVLTTSRSAFGILIRNVKAGTLRLPPS